MSERKTYWLSLDDKNNDKPKAVGEFLSTPVREGYEKDGLDRRDFMKIMGASALMASLAGCSRRPIHKLVPYVRQPEEITHGLPNYYASSCPETGYGLLLTTREGRPIKVDGNPEHPINRGGLNARGQAAIYDLYDPDRLRSPKIEGQEVSWEKFDQDVNKILSQSRGRTYILTSTIHSPSLLSLISKSQSKHIMYDVFPMDDIHEGQAQSYGKSVLPRYRFDKADVIVSIDADFLDTWISSVEYTNQFSKKRKINTARDSMSRLIVFESMMQLTGQNADERHAILPQHQLLVALGLAQQVAQATGASAPELAGISIEKIAEVTGIEKKVFQSVARELAKARGRSLVVAGGIAGKGPNAVQLQNIVNFINSTLGNDGITVEATNSVAKHKQGSVAELRKLIQAMKSGAVRTLIVQGLNPLYDLPTSLGFREALKNVDHVIYIGKHADETSAICKYVAAEDHAFESWGDTQAQEHLYSIVQPTIRPLWQTKSFLQMLLDWSSAMGTASAKKHAYEVVRDTWQDVHRRYHVSSGFEDFWEESLKLGFYDGLGKEKRDQHSAPRSFRRAILAEAVSRAEKILKAPDLGLTLLVHSNISVGEGTQANNSLLQELPDPITKNTWGNYLAVAVRTAEELNIKDGDIVRLTAGGTPVEVIAHRQPGLKTGVIALAYGYGRQFHGRVGNNVGVSATNFITPIDNTLAFIALNAQVEKTGNKGKLSCTQGHHSLEGRDIIFETTIDEFRRNPASGIVHHEAEQPTMWSEHEYPGYRWGMAIDLNSCTGCSACITACDVENNVPAVGKDQVELGREMHWIRIDRYYAGDEENPDIIHQPMLCQHCENAPCETVCPVVATTHSSEGLNQMIYNRCVGTRYCSNNCPYKVRRFNWYENNAPMNKGMEHPLALAKNPEVTLRSRGIMEKCTFCVQRIESAKSRAKTEARHVKDGDIITACQAACPADAIVFGNVNDPSSRVAKMLQHPRAFATLEELNTRPAVRYLTKVRNRAKTEEKV